MLLKKEKSNEELKSKILLIIVIPIVAFNLFFVLNSVFGFTTSIAGGAVTVDATPGEKTSYGITLDNSGYQQLLEFDQTINVASLTPEQQSILKKLLGRDEQGNVIIPHPCCGVSISECAPCGHGQAIRGLIKYLLQQRWSEKDILSESLNWDRLFFPGQV